MLTKLNEAVLLALHNVTLSTEWLYDSVAFVTKPIVGVFLGAFDSIVIGSVFLVLFIYYDGKPGLLAVDKYTWRKLAVISLTGVIAWAGSVTLKAASQVPRPYEALDIMPLFRVGTLDSFPSGHAMFFAAVAVAVYHYHRNLGALFVLATVLIGLGRIMAGVHYPLDILAGIAFGGGGAIVMMWLVKRFPVLRP